MRTLAIQEELLLGRIFGRKKKNPLTVELNPEQDVFLGSANQELNEKRRLTHEKYGFDKNSWFYDQETGEFQLKDGETIIHKAEGQIAGTYFKPDGTWEWAWNNPNWKKELVKDSNLVKEYGEKEGLHYFTGGTVCIGSEEYGEYFAAVGVKLSSSESAYFGDTGDLIVYIMLKNFKTC